MAERALTVVQVLPALDEGGVERGTLEIAEHLVRHGHRSVVISQGGRLLQGLIDSGSEHLDWPIGRKSLLTLRLIPRLRRLLSRQRVDIVHARSRLPAWIAYWALRGLDPGRRPRFVTTVHGLYSVNAYSAVMTRGERVIAVSDTVRDYVQQNYEQVDIERVRVIHRGIDVIQFPHGYRPSTQWQKAWRSELPELDDKFVVLMPGRLTRLKGHHHFLAIIDRLMQSGLAVHGLIAGDDRTAGGYVSELKEEIRDQGLAITFLGHRSDIKDVYAAADVVLSLSSQPESFGRTILEPLSLGVPVVAYAHGGVGEILERMFPRGAVPAGDIAAASDRIKEFMEQPHAVPSDNPFPLSRMQERTLALYLRLANER